MNLKELKIGNCFDANGEIFLCLSQGSFPEIDIPEEIRIVMSKVNKWKLVHATLLNRKDNQPFSHCWIEGDEIFVFDFTSGIHPSDMASYRNEYYAMQKIPIKDYPEDWKNIEDQAYLFKYSRKDVRRVIARLGDNMSWGPWDFEVTR